MFPFPPQPFPHRQRRDLARAAQLHQLNRQMSAPPAGILGSMYGPTPLGVWPSGPMRPYNVAPPVLPSPFTAPYAPSPSLSEVLEHMLEVDDRPPPVRSPSVSSVNSYRARRSPPPQTPIATNSRYRRSPPRQYSRSSSHNGAWPQAARSLHDILKAALDYSSSFESIFDEDVRRISLYCDPALIPYLWTAMVDWDGVVPSEKKENPDARPRNEIALFRRHAQRVLEAKEEFERAGFPGLGTRIAEGNAALAPEDVRTTMEKLGVSLRAIEGLLGAVRRDRTRFVALVRELQSAHAMMLELKELWETSKRDGTRFGDRFSR